MSVDRPLRILIVSPSLPYPPAWGFGIRVFHFLKQLAARHDVTLLAFAGRDEAKLVPELQRTTGARIHFVVRDEPATRTKRSAQVSSLFRRESFQRRSLWSDKMQAALTELLETGAFDVIQVESSQMFGYTYGSSASLLLDEHNVEYELLYRTYRTERSALRKLFNWVEYRKFRAEEQQSWVQADACILTSQREEQMLREHTTRTRTTVVPNGVDVDFFRAGPEVPDLNSIVFVGVMHYRPNVDAALYFIKDILPHVVRQRPAARFTIVGGGAPDELRRLAGPHVEFTDTVPDTRPYVSRAGVFVVPLRMGSGTRLKVLEGLAMSRPLVSTSLGCEGIDAIHGEHLLVADDAVGFAREVVRSLEDRELAARLGRNGRELVERGYSWRFIVQQLEAFMLSLRASAPPGHGIGHAAEHAG